MRHIYKLKNSDKATFYIPGEVKAMPAPTSKRPAEREFEVDSGASMHMMSKKELSSEELLTVERSRTPTVVLTANGEVHTYEEAQVFVHDLIQFVTVQLLEETPVVLSLGKFCKGHGYSYQWVSGQEPRLTQNGKKYYLQNRQFCTSCRSRVICQFRKQFVFYYATTRIVGTRDTPLVSGKQSCSKLIFRFSIRAKWRLVLRRLGQESLRSDKKDENDWLADVPFWFEVFMENLKPTESACTRTHFSGLIFGTSCESGKEIEDAQHLHSLPERPKLRRLLENQNNKSVLQETHWRSSTACRKVWWLDNGWSQRLQWGMWI